MNLTPSMSYSLIEEAIADLGYSVRQSVDPLHLHKDGVLVAKFKTKLSLVEYLNMKMRSAA